MGSSSCSGQSVASGVCGLQELQCAERGLRSVWASGVAVGRAWPLERVGFRSSSGQSVASGACGLEELQWAGSVAEAHGLSRLVTCEIFLNQGSNPCPLHWQVDSLPLDCRGSPQMSLSKLISMSLFWFWQVMSEWLQAFLGILLRGTR